MRSRGVSLGAYVAFLGSIAVGRTRQESLRALGCAGVRVSGSGVEKAESVPRKSTCSRNVRSLQEVALADRERVSGSVRLLRVGAGGRGGD